MREHYNLYYIFLEEKIKYPISEEANREIQKKVEEFYEKIKPNLFKKPP